MEVPKWQQAGGGAGFTVNGYDPSSNPSQPPFTLCPQQPLCIGAARTRSSKLVVNLKAAKAVGLTIPESFLARADEVIE
jgi:hypothetical protein